MAYYGYPQNYPNGYPQNSYQTNSYQTIVHVQSEDEARNYPVAPNNSVLFIDDMSQCLYLKTMGASQLDAPTFDRYKLVKEPTTPAKTAQEKGYNLSDFATKSELEGLRDELRALRDSLKPRTLATEVSDDE